MSITHLSRPEGFGSVCNSKTKILRTTANPSGADCGRCRKASGLGKYNAMDALSAIFPIKINSESTS